MTEVRNGTQLREYHGDKTLFLVQREPNHAGARYDGDVSIATGLREGKGTYHYPNPYFVYEGEWLAGKKHGQGRLSFDIGGYYEGEFHEGEITGSGYQEWADGSTYQGQFLLGCKDGEGTWRKADGTSYSGGWAQNRYSGHGELILKDGTRYVGGFRGHKFHEKGTHESQTNGFRYEGGFRDGQRHGVGELAEQGCTYKGAFDSGFKHGNGLGTHVATGVSYQGDWQRDRPVQGVASLDVGPVESADVSYLTAAEALKEQAAEQLNPPDPKAKGKKDPKGKTSATPTDGPPTFSACMGQSLPEISIRQLDAASSATSAETGRLLRISIFKERKAPANSENPEEILRRPVNFGDRRPTYIDPLDEAEGIVPPPGKGAGKGAASPTEDDQDEEPPSPGVEWKDVVVGEEGYITIGGSEDWFLPAHLQPAIYWLKIEDVTDFEEGCWFQRLPVLEFPFHIQPM
eukprot:TRINITY_DN13006_c0_g4_i1.p1 TRINITY_DN13006_c0_g4~~TRINITY_DN13006_c0_g4_i1.p1  ORF type:complete len:460 (+),score=87.56 TRINITY_DN13006_c0_g4_i1:90-1469(+)